MELAARLHDHVRDALVPLVEHSDRGVVATCDGIAVRAVGRGGPAFNTASVFAPPRDPEAALDEACGLLGATGRPYTVQVPADLRPALSDALERRGVVRVETNPGMVLSPLPEPPPAPEHLRVVPVREPVELAAHATALARGFGAPDPAAAVEVFPPTLLDDQRVTMLSGYVDGHEAPVATSVSVVLDGVAGVFGVTVADAVRRRGFGAAMTWAAVGAGERKGADVAALQATELGFGVYAAIGFRTVLMYERYAVV